MKRLLAAATAVALATPATARAAVPADCGLVDRSTPFAFVRANTVCVDLSAFIQPIAGTGLFSLVLANRGILNATGQQIGLINNLDVTFKPEPYIDFSVNTGNPLFAQTDYEFYFGTPIDPGTYARATSTGGVAVTSSLTDASVLQSGSTTRFITVYGGNGPDLIPMGVDIGTGTCDASGVLATNSCQYPPPAGGPASNTFPRRFLDSIEADLIYTQDGLASDAGWEGRADVFLAAPVPEPSTVALVATGAALLVGGAYRRARR